MPRSKDGLQAAGEWHQLQPLFPDVAGKRVLDLGCGYGWHCKYAAEQGARQVLGLDLSQKMLERASRENAGPAALRITPTRRGPGTWWCLIWRCTTWRT